MLCASVRVTRVTVMRDLLRGLVARNSNSNAGSDGGALGLETNVGRHCKSDLKRWEKEMKVSGHWYNQCRPF